ncbi:MAG: glycosyltransferase, partial [Gammaproteobacteria bacterium]
MAHFGVVTPAFYSHFSTMAALAAELVERGHRVTFLHRVDARAFVRDARLGFHALGAATHPAGSLAADLRRAANPGHPLGLRRVILDMAATTDMLCRELPGAIETLAIDALLADQMEAAGGLVAAALGLPFISVACALPVNREPGIPLPVMPFLYSDTPKGHKMVEGSTRVYDWFMAPHRASIERQAARLGLAGRHALHDCLSPLAQISQTVAAFDFPRRMLPAHFHHVGPLRPTRAAPAGERFVPADIAPGRPFVFASLGTMQGSRLALFKRIVQACRMLDAQVLVAHCGGLAPDQEAVLRRAGATWVCAFADQEAVLARADAVVSHGGANTVIDAVAAHTPHLALPIAFDHPGAAARVEFHGVGLRASAFFSSPRQLARQLNRLLTEPHFGPPLARLSEAARQAGGTR